MDKDTTEKKLNVHPENKGHRDVRDRHSHFQLTHLVFAHLIPPLLPVAGSAGVDSSDFPPGVYEGVT